MNFKNLERRIDKLSEHGKGDKIAFVDLKLNGNYIRHATDTEPQQILTPLEMYELCKNYNVIEIFFASDLNEKQRQGIPKPNKKDKVIPLQHYIDVSEYLKSCNVPDDNIANDFAL